MRAKENPLMTSLPPGNDLATEEFRALRATIRERGTARLVTSALIFPVWAAVAVYTSRELPTPGMVLFPLLVLWAGFEVIFAAHVGVERIGRYLQARYESGPATLPGWEHAAMGLDGRPGAATGTDPLLIRLFTMAGLLNLLPLVPLLADAASTAVIVIPFAIALVLHATFLVRLTQARRFARSQRRRDLELFGARHDPRESKSLSEESKPADLAPGRDG
jgi:hypothetical protein